MPRSKNGATPQKSTEQVATELRGRLEQALGRERTDAIWQDPTRVQDVLANDDEAASVTQIFLRAWKELPREESSEREKRPSGFRRGVRLALIAAIAVWAASLLRRARPESGGPPL